MSGQNNLIFKYNKKDIVAIFFNNEYFFTISPLSSVIQYDNKPPKQKDCKQHRVKMGVRSAFPGMKGNNKEESVPTIMPIIITFFMCFLFTKNKSHGHIKYNCYSTANDQKGESLPGQDCLK